MRILSLFLILSFCGCNVAPRRSEPPTSPASIGFADRLPMMLKEAAAENGWTTTVVSAGRTAASVDGVSWEWSEQTVPVIFLTSKPDRPDQPLTTAEATSVMKSLRGELRNHLRKQGSEILDATESESFHERSVVISYRNGRIDGWIKATLKPNSEAAEETGNKLEVVVREVYGRE